MGQKFRGKNPGAPKFVNSLTLEDPKRILRKSKFQPGIPTYVSVYRENAKKSKNSHIFLPMEPRKEIFVAIPWFLGMEN